MDRAEIKAEFNVNDEAAIGMCSDDEIDETTNKLIKREPSESPSPGPFPASWAELNEELN